MSVYNTTGTQGGGFNDFIVENYDYIVNPVATWSLLQCAIMPLLFVVPAEILALFIDGTIYACESLQLPALPGPLRKDRPSLKFKDYAFVIFNRLVGLPFVAMLNVRAIWASDAVVWDGDYTFMNTVVAFLVIFSLSDLVYYLGHRLVHGVPWLYNFVHKHHHGEPVPIRGWFDTCNAHPTDFFYTGFSTSPLSVLWLMPAGFVHITTLAVILYSVMFVGALGHSRLDFSIGVFNSRFHAGHHAMFKYNYAQNIELWDRIFGTHKDLEVPVLKKVQ